MNEMLYMLTWILVVAISTLLFYVASGTLSLRKPNLHSFVYYYAFLLSSLIGTLLIVLNVDKSYIVAKLLHQESRIVGFTLICIASVLLPLTMVILSKLFGFRAKEEFYCYWHAPIKRVVNNKKYSSLEWIITILACISLSSIIYVFVYSETIPILDKLFGDGRSIGELRQGAKTGYFGNIFIKNIFALGFTPLLSLIAYAFSISTGRRIWKIQFLILFSCSLLIELYDLQKGPVLFYLAMFLLLRMYLGKTRLSLRIILSVLLIGTLYLGIAYTSAGVKDANSYLSYSRGPIGRIILTQIAPTFIYADRYNTVYPHLEERGLPSPILKIYDIKEVRSARILIQDLFPEKTKEGVTGVLNTLFVGEAYATWGLLGVIFGAVYLGALIQLLYIHFLRMPKHPIFLCLFIYFMVNIPRALVGGFSDLLFNPLWIILYGVLVGTYVLFRPREEATTTDPTKGTQ